MNNYKIIKKNNNNKYYKIIKINLILYKKQMESNLIKKRIQLNHNLSISDSLLQAKEPISKSKRKFSSLFISLLSIIALAIIANRNKI